MKKLSILLAATLLSIAAPPARAAESRQPGNRFLFLIDTASAMRGYSNAVAQSVVDLMESNLRGEFRKGDTIGLWTYSDKLHPDFPMQVWSERRKDVIAGDMAAYLQAQHYEKSAHLDRVMPALNTIVKGSERVTIILIFDGSGAITGTPFDKDIATLQKKYARELKAAHVPFVLVLAAHDGAVFDYTINYPGLVAIPHTAYPEPVATNAPVVAAPPPPVVAPKPVSLGRSIIMSRSTNVVQTPAPVPVVATPANPVVPATPPPAPAVVVVAPAPAPVVKPAPPQVVAPVPPVQPTPPPVVVEVKPAPEPVKATPHPPVAAPVAAPVVEEKPKPAAAPVATVPVVQPAPIAAVAEPVRNAPIALFVMGFLLLTIAAISAVLLLRRSKGPAESSLISQSIDRRPRG